MAIPDYRPNPSDKPIITFSETKARGPVAIKEWFYPGDQYGQEFVYPKNRAVELAKESNQPVPSQPQQTASNINRPAQSASDQSVKDMEASSLKAEQPSGQEVEVAEVFIVQAPPADDGTRTVAQKLPQTASSLPLLSVWGIFLLLLGGLFWWLQGVHPNSPGPFVNGARPNRECARGKEDWEGCWKQRMR